ncbi:MAG: hypothetical protein KF686_16035 [Ramlibacter sp.]|nr:hypothetical protein [Ramlibacter sp.]
MGFLHSIGGIGHEATQLARRIARVDHALLAWVVTLTIAGVWGYLLWVFLPGLWALTVLLVLFGGLYSLSAGLIDLILRR